MKTLIKEVTVSPEGFSVFSFTKTGKYLAPLIMAAIDYGVVVGALLTAWYMRERVLLEVFSLESFHLKSSYIYFVIPAIYLLFFAYEGLYVKRLPFWKSAEILFKLCSYVNILVIVVTFFADRDGGMPRMLVALSWIISFLYLVVSRHVTKRFLLYCGLWQKPVIIIGAGKTAEILADSFKREPQLGYKIVGLIEDQYKDRPLIHKYPYIGSFANAEQTIRDSDVQDVIMAVPGMEREKMLDFIYRIQPHVRNLTVVPDLFGIPLTNMEVETLYNEKTVMLKIRNNLAILRNRIIKRLFDVTLSVIGIAFIWPFLAGLAVLIYTSSPGPIIFAHRRVGKDGKEFNCYKFRTMIVNAQEVLEQYLNSNPSAREEWEKDFKLKNDPRITKVGDFLRKTSLDELPQLINVLKGEMSLVGPRPIIDKEIIKYGNNFSDYKTVTPGITGYWQVSGRNDIDYDTRVKMDSWYVRNWSLWQDIVLLLKTIKVVIGRKGAY